jgi:hypothetical protein
MNLLKKKSKTSTRDPRVYMPVKKNISKPLPKRKQSPFKKLGGQTSKHVKRRHLKMPKPSLYVILVLLFLGISYLAVVYINKLRNTEEVNSNIEYVVGLNGIPSYPKSSFIFQNSLSDESVKNLLSKGGSAYRLSGKSTVDDVFEYYKEKLPALGWTFIQQVGLEQEDKEYGQYWSKDGNGLRIYAKYNDVWYQTITVQQAENGLADQVQAQEALNQLLATEEVQDLLPDFPWILQVPNDYVISYSTSKYDENLQQVLFSKLNSDEKVYLIPICNAQEKALEKCLNDYVLTVNIATSKTWTLTGVTAISSNTGSGVEGQLRAGSDTKQVAVINDSYNNIIYVIDSNITSNPFVDYILSNIESQNTKKY